MFCNPQKTDDGAGIVCPKCQQIFPITMEEFAAINYDATRIIRICQAPIVNAPITIRVPPAREPAKPPAFPRKFANFVWSTVKHLAHGAPRCTQVQIDARLAVCVQCPSNQFVMRDENTGTCAVCGCCGSNDDTFFNKLARADESCPHGHWKPVENILKEIDNRA